MILSSEGAGAACLAAMSHDLGYMFGRFLRDVSRGEASWSELKSEKPWETMTQSSITPVMQGISYFAIAALRRRKEHDALLAAARPLARKLLRAGEPGRLIDGRCIETMLRKTTDALRSTDRCKRQSDGRAPFHLTVELVALFLAVCEADALEAETKALSVSETPPVEDEGAAPPAADAPAADAPAADAPAADAPAAALPMPAATSLVEVGDGGPVRVLVTGATGLIGLATFRQLARNGGFVVTATSATAPEAGLAAELKEAGVKLVVADLCDENACARLCDGQHAVVHAAGRYPAWPLDAPNILSHDPEYVEATTTLAGAARKAGVQRFLHLSTAALYFGHAGRKIYEAGDACATHAYPEWMPTPFADSLPSGTYLASCLEAEVRVQLASLEGLPTVTLRPAIVVADQNPWVADRVLPLLSARRMLMPGLADGTVDYVHGERAHVWIARACSPRLPPPSR